MIFIENNWARYLFMAIVCPMFFFTDAQGKRVEKKSVTEELQCVQTSIDDTDTSAATSQHRLPSCYLDINSLKAFVENPASIVIDIRSSKAYTEAHIPAAINLSVSEIKTKSYLKERPVLIYSSGKYDASIEELCFSLKRHGFKNIKILSGGIVSWIKHASTEKASVSNIDFQSMLSLSALELFSETLSDGSLLINLSPKFNIKSITARQVSMSLPLSPDDLNLVVRKLIGKQPKRKTRRIVVVGLAEADRIKLNNLLVSTEVQLPIFAYFGSSGDYEKSISYFNIMLDKKSKGATPKGCGFL